MNPRVRYARNFSEGFAGVETENGWTPSGSLESARDHGAAVLEGPTAPSGSVPLLGPQTDRSGVTTVASVVAGRYAARSASGRFRVRGKDCVRLKERHNTSPR